MWKEFITGFRNNNHEAGEPEYKRISKRSYVNLASVVAVEEDETEALLENGEWDENVPCVKVTLAAGGLARETVRVFDRSYEELVELVKLVPRNYKGA